jgi:hypothetical protein
MLYHIPAAYDVHNNLLSSADYSIVSSFLVEPLDPEGPPYTLGLWVIADENNAPSISAAIPGRVTTIYLTDEQQANIRKAA